MQNLDLVLSAVLCMRQSGLTRSRQAVYGCNILAAVSQCVFFLSAVAGSVTVAVGNRPCHRQCALLVLTKISHTENAGTVCLCIEIAESLFLWVRQAVQGYARSVGAIPLRIGENKDIGFLAVSHRFGVLVHLDILVRHVLEV